MATIPGTAGNDVLTSGLDTLTGLPSDDTLIGYAGNDTYYIDSKNDVVVEALNAGIDSVYLSSNCDFEGTTSYTLAENVEKIGLSALDLTGVGSFSNVNKLIVSGNALANTISIGENGSEIKIIAAAGNDTITGGVGNDEVDGGLGLDLISTNAGNDILFGGYDTMADTLNGGSGDDTYIIKDTKDKIYDVNDASTNTIKLDSTFTETSLSLTERRKYNFSSSYISEIDASAITKALTLTGNASASTNIIGGAGKDTITGGTAADTFAGGYGDDLYYISNTNDTIIENAGAGTGTDKIIVKSPVAPLTIALAANVENIDASAMSFSANITGNSLGNSIIGGKGNDTLYGGLDAIRDSLLGGKGSDIYYVNDYSDTISDTGTSAEGTDTIALTDNYDDNIAIAGASYTLINKSIEVLDGSLSANDLYLVGNTATATKIIGGAGKDTLIGGTGNDVLIGGAGIDSLVGGNGNDTYVIDNTGSDTIFEAAGKTGTDTVKLSSAWTDETVSVTSFNNIENIDASSALRNVILYGNDVSNVLTGSNSSDILNGGVGADSLIGGKGSDLYFVDNSLNKIFEKEGEGYDKVVLKSNFKSSVYELISNVEFLDATDAVRGMALTGSDKTGMTILSTDYNDTVKGGAGTDTILGYAGNDKIYGQAGNDQLDGGDGADYIDGGAGKDIIYAGFDTEIDTLAGGLDADEYWLTDTNDIIIDDSTTGNTIRLNERFADAGISLAKDATLDYNYSGANINFLDAHFVDTQGLFLAGNNIITKVVTKVPATTTTKATTVTTYVGKDALIYGTDFSDSIVGYAGNDDLWGGWSGNPTLYGGGDDVIYGGTGNNKLVGGIDDDTYIIDGLAASTTITELSDTEKQAYGKDTIKLIANEGAFIEGFDVEKFYTTGKFNNLATYSISLAAYANVENIDASLIDGTKLTLTGNDVGNIIIGGASDDSIVGGAKGDDLYGGNGNDTIYGGQGINTLNGGNGDDTYKVSLADEEAIEGNAWSMTVTPHPTLPNVEIHTEAIPKMLTEFTDSDGIDTLILAGKTSYSTEYPEHFNMTLPGGIDNLDAAAITYECRLKITGNALDNIITGGKGLDTINSGNGDDTVYDYELDRREGIWRYESNWINVGEGNNTVITGLGHDTIYAGSFDEDDNFTGNTGNDFVNDYDGDNYINVGNGNNRIYTGAGEDLIITGTGEDYIISGDGTDLIFAGDGNDSIDSGLANDNIYAEGGNDNITGGGGNDRIYSGSGNDTIDGGDGTNTFEFGVGDEKDLILSTSAADIINIDDFISTDDILFYTDNLNNFYIDYTFWGVGTDVAHIAASNYDDNTTIKIGSSTININTIIGQLTAATTGLDNTAITNLNTTDESNQANVLTWST